MRLPLKRHYNLNVTTECYAFVEIAVEAARVKICNFFTSSDFYPLQNPLISCFVR